MWLVLGLPFAILGIILEARKNVEAMVNDVVVSGEVVELQALIEALNKALTLDLKSITFFRDDYNCE